MFIKIEKVKEKKNLKSSYQTHGNG